MNPSMFFLSLPVLKELVCVSVTLQQEDEDLRSTRIKTCRELVLLYSDILASPALDSSSDITVVTSIPFFQRGFLQVFGQRRSLQLGCPQPVSPGVLQCCLSYSLITRLAPSWNKAGLYLVSGKHFLSESGRLNAVGMELSTSEGQLCLSIEVNTVRLPPTRLEDFDLPPLVLRRFCCDPDSVLDPSSTGGALWCHVLPSMKKGQIITITRQLPRDGPFRTYRDLQDHWNHLYGYRLPDLAEEELVYCSVYFRLVGERLFTYPLSCVRLQPVQRCPRVDPGALSCFLSDVGDELTAVCGFPARLTGKPRYHTVGLSTAAALQVFGGEQINLSDSSSSITQLPPPPPPRPVKPYFGSQPPAWTPQDGAQGLLGNRLTQSQGCRGDRDWPPSSSSSSSSSFSFSSLFQPASSLSSSVLPPLPPPPPPMIFGPNLVPIFKNKCPSYHVNVALLRLQKQREQLIGGGEERGRVTLPTFRTRTSTTSTSSSSSVSSLSVPSLTLPPPFNRRPKPSPQPAGHIGVKRIASLSPPSKSRPGFLLAPQTEITKPKTSSKTSVKSSSDTNVSNKAAPPSDISFKRPPAAPPSDISFKRPPAPPPSISNKRPPPSDISNKHPPLSDISNKRPPPSDISNKHPPPSDISNKHPPPSDISNKHPPPSDISNKRPPPSDISFKRPPAPPPSDISFKRPPAPPPSDISFKRPPAPPPSISNKRPPPSDISNKHPPPSDISFKHPPPSDISFKRPPAPPPSDISFKRPPAPPPSDISFKRPPAPPPSDISFKRPPAPPPSDISNKRPPPSDNSNKRPPPSDISNKRPPPSDISFKRPPAPPPSDISFKRPPAPPPSDISNKRPPPSDNSNKHPPPSDISNKRPPPSDISNKRPPPSDISFKRPPAPPPSISNKRPPPSDISNKHPPPSDISFKRPPAPPPSISNKRPPPSDISNKDTSSSSRRRVVFEESKPKKHRSSVRDVDVEQMARSNQLSKVNSATLLFWLEGRGVLIRTKHRKEDLMLKVMGCLAEA